MATYSRRHRLARQAADVAGESGLCGHSVAPTLAAAGATIQAHQRAEGIGVQRQVDRLSWGLMIHPSSVER
jgi:hypothetical protein